MTAAKKIAKRIEKAPPGTVFVPSDFHDISSVDNANAVLSRMTRKGEIMRAIRGVYTKPKHIAALDKDVPPLSRRNRPRHRTKQPLAHSPIGQHRPQPPRARHPGTRCLRICKQRSIQDLSVRQVHNKAAPSGKQGLARMLFHHLPRHTSTEGTRQGVGRPRSCPSTRRQAFLR